MSADGVGASAASETSSNSSPPQPTFPFFQTFSPQPSAVSSSTTARLERRLAEADEAFWMKLNKPFMAGWAPCGSGLLKGSRRHLSRETTRLTTANGFRPFAGEVAVLVAAAAQRGTLTREMLQEQLAKMRERRLAGLGGAQWGAGVQQASERESGDDAFSSEAKKTDELRRLLLVLLLSRRIEELLSRRWCRLEKGWRRPVSAQQRRIAAFSWQLRADRRRRGRAPRESGEQNSQTNSSKKPPNPP